jgi:hypothetical protein
MRKGAIGVVSGKWTTGETGEGSGCSGSRPPFGFRAHPLPAWEVTAGGIPRLSHHLC